MRLTGSRVDVGTEVRISISFSKDGEEEKYKPYRSGIYSSLTKVDQWYPNDVVSRMVKSDAATTNWDRWQ